MNENKLKSIINELVGFERKFITIDNWMSGKFGGLAWVQFTVKGEQYIIEIKGEEFTFDFYVPDEEDEQDAPDSDRDYMHEKYEDHVSRETSEAVEAEAVTEA